MYRGDYNLNDKNLITLRIIHEEVDQINPSRNYSDPAPNPDSAAYTPSGNSLLHWQYSITTTSSTPPASASSTPSTTACLRGSAPCRAASTSRRYVEDGFARG